MKEVTIRGVEYRIGTLNAFAQMYILKRAAPVLGKLQGVFQGYDKERPEEILEPLGAAIGLLPDESLEYVCNACLDVCERHVDGGGWAPVRKGGALMYAELDLLTLLSLTAHVLQANLADFFRALPSLAPGGAGTATA